MYAFLATTEGAVWIAAEAGLSVWKDGALIDIPSAGAQITSVSADRDGTVWVTRNGVKDGTGPVCLVTQAKTLKCFGERDGIATHYAQNIVQDAHGDYWIAAGAVTRWRPGSKGTVFFSDELSGFGTGWGVQTLMIDTDGTVLAGLSVSGKTAGLQRYKDGHWAAVMTSSFDGSVHSAGRMFRDHEGALWVYTLDDSLGRVDGDRFELFGPAQGLSGDTVSAILQDREETIWVATNKGIDSFTRPAVVTFTEKDGTWIHSNLLFTDADGALWLGRSTLARFVAGEAQLHPGFTTQNGSKRVTAMLQDHDGRLWVAIYDTVYLVRGDEVTKIHDSSGLDHLVDGDIVKSIVEDAHRNLWAYIVGKDVDRLVRISPDGIVDVRVDRKVDRLRWLAADKQGGLWLAGENDRLLRLEDGREETYRIPSVVSGLEVNELLLDPNDALLLSTTQGLVIFKAREWHAVGTTNGLPCAGVDSTVLAGNGDAWLSTRCSLVHIAKADLAGLGTPFQGTVPQTSYGALDGWAGSISIASHKSIRAGDGKLWFSNIAALQMIDPQQLADNPMQPPIRIERIVADRRTYDPSGTVTIPPDPKSVQFDYTALSLVEPRKMHFKYRLVGHDLAWQDPGLRRQAFYNDLGPGAYRFEVMASNDMGRWTTEATGIAFTIEPTFFQTTAFKVVCALVFIGFVWLAYIVRIRQVTRTVEKTARDRALERQRIARDLHDTFFQTMQSLFLRVHTAMNQLPEASRVQKDGFDAILRDSDRAMAEGRDMFLDAALHESGDEDLGALLEKIGAEFSSAYGVPYSVSHSSEPRALKPAVRDEVYKLGREALYNAFRHANASGIRVDVTYGERSFVLRISDDGGGFDASGLSATGGPARWGMKGMAERARTLGGTLSVASGLAQGTQIELVVDAAHAYAS